MHVSLLQTELAMIFLHSGHTSMLRSGKRKTVNKKELKINASRDTFSVKLRLIIRNYSHDTIGQ